MSAATITVCDRCGLPADALIHTGSANAHEFVGPGKSFTLTHADAAPLGWVVPAWVREIEVLDRDTVAWIGQTELVAITDLTTEPAKPVTVRIRPLRYVNPYRPEQEQEAAQIEVVGMSGQVVADFEPDDARRVAAAMIRAADQMEVAP